MERITLDFSNCEKWYDVYDEIITKCEFPKWCATHLDGLWDFFEEDFVVWNEPDIITIIGTKKMSTEAFSVFKEINDTVFARVMEKAPNVRFEIIS